MTDRTTPPASFADQPIIDFRLRPPHGELVKLRIWDAELRATFAGKMRVQQARSAQELSVDLLLEEMRALNVVLGVMNARADGREGVGSAGNESVAELQGLHPERFRGFGAVDLNSSTWAADALRAIRDLGLHGISIDPGFSRPVIDTTDPRVYELADLCEAESVPLMVTLSVIAGPHVSDARPDGIDRLAEARPNLQIVLAHASWPYFAEAIAIAFRRPNLWLVPDMYMVGFAGARDMVEAANGILRDQILFGSAYPSAPVADCIDAYWRLGLEEEAAAAIYYKNAARLLGTWPDSWT